MKTVRTSLCLLVSSVASAQQYVISTVAGGVPQHTPAPGKSLFIGTAFGVTADDAGNLYFSSSDLNSVFRLNPDGSVDRVAGNNAVGYSGDGGFASRAELNAPKGLAVDGAGNLFIADSGNRRIRRVSKDGVITTVAGSGACCFSGDGGPALSAAMANPFGLAVDGRGNLFVGDLSGNRVRKISSAGIITTVAGDGSEGFFGDGGPATSAALRAPAGVAVDGSGNLFIADYNNSRVRKVSPDGIITTIAGLGTFVSSGDGGPAVSAGLIRALGLALDREGNLYITDFGGIRKISISGIITTVAGGGQAWFSSSDGDRATDAAILPLGVALDGAGDLFIADAVGSSRIRKVTPDGIIATLAGNDGESCCFSGDGGPACNAQLNDPAGVALDGSGNIYIADGLNGRIRRVSANGVISTVADGCGASDDYVEPCGIAVNARGNIYVSDENGVRRTSPDGSTTKISDTSSFGIALDRVGNLYMVDHCQIRRFSEAGQTIVVAGNGICGYSGDGGPATAAQLEFSVAVTVDRADNLYFADNLYLGDASRIRRVSPDGVITTIAGGGSGALLDGNLATSGRIGSVIGLAADTAGGVYFQEFSIFSSENYPSRIRKISPDGTVSTIAGTGDSGYSGDGGPAILSRLNPSAYERGNNLTVDSGGNVYLADEGNNAIRVLRPVHEPLVIGSVVNAARQDEAALSPGMVVVIYGAGLGPSQLIQNEVRNGQLGTAVGGTQVAFNGIAAPILYTSSTQVAAVVPYAITGATAQVTVIYQGQASAPRAVPIMPSSPGVFTLNQTGAGQAAATNAVDGTVNTAANPVKIGAYICLYATGEGQTIPAGVDGRLSSTSARPVLPLSVTVGGIPAFVQYAGGSPGQVAGLMQINVQIPTGVQPGGYVPVLLQVGNASTRPGAVWVAVSGN